MSQLISFDPQCVRDQSRAPERRVRVAGLCASLFAVGVLLAGVLGGVPSLADQDGGRDGAGHPSSSLLPASARP